MGKGCIFFAVILALILGVAGYIAYTYMGDIIDLPDGLEAYENPRDAFSLLESKAPAPGPDVQLTEERVKLYIGSLDSSSIGWEHLRKAFDSMTTKNAAGDSTTGFDIWSSPKLIRSFRIALPLTRRAMISYLNRHHLSWDEYLWMKKRVVAASNITRQEVHSITQSSFVPNLGIDFMIGDSTSRREADSLASGFGDADTFFNAVEELRRSGAVDSTEQRLVAPYRQEILSRGLPSLVGIESEIREGR